MSAAMDTRVSVEVVSYLPTAFFHCQHCEVIWRESGFSRGVHDEQLRTSLPPDLQEQQHEVASWVAGVAARYGDRVRLRPVDAVSVEGLYLAVRFRLRRYPAVIVRGRPSWSGTSFPEAEAAIGRRLAPAAGAT